MEKNKPPFEIKDEMVNLVALINEKIGRIESNNTFENNLQLRRKNRVKTIKSTTAIENNTLSLQQVKDIINGKIVLGKRNEIMEIKNAVNAYYDISTYNPFDIKSFIKAHYNITESLINSAGKFRIGDGGVYEGDRLIHIGARSDFLYELISDLFEWGKNTDTHPLIASSVIHYEIETIHPFDDGNGRIGRLWQTVLLYNWKKIFEYIPIENIIHKHQNLYYEAIEISRKEGVSNKFILFMLEVINESLDDIECKQITDIITDKLSKTEKEVLTEITGYLIRFKVIDNAKAKTLINKSFESTKKYLARFVSLNVLIPFGDNKGRVYKLNEEALKTKEEI